MAEDKKTVPAPTPGKDLTSKIATAFRSLPPEEREKPLQEPIEVENAELDKAFDKMVDMYKVRRPERENAVVTFPAPPTLRVPKPEPAPQGEDYECPECGHNNPAANQFCGMCGAAREDAAPSEGLLEPGEMVGAVPLEGGAKHHHHYYHHHHYRNNPYLLVAVVLLLAIIAWQQWQANKQQASPKPTAPITPAVQVQPAAPVQSQPAPASKPASQTPPSAPAKTGQPQKKPAPQSSTQPPAPTRQGEPPGPEAKAHEIDAPSAATPISYKPLTQQALPALPLFSAKPPKPAGPQPRLTLSQEVSAGRLIRRVPPNYPLVAKRAGVQGEVVLRAVIAKDGSVQDVKIVSGNRVLAEAALQAVRQWRYQPATLNGQLVEAETLVQVNFKR